MSDVKNNYLSLDENEKVFSRRNFIGGSIIAASSSFGVAAGETEKTKQEKTMPVWSGREKLKPKKKPEIPTTAKPNGLNMVVIIADTFRLDHIGCYGSKMVKTPYLDKLAKESVVFTNAHAEGLPTIPSRRVYHTGKSVLPHSRWEPLSEFDITFSEVLGKHRFTTGFIADTYHHFKADYNFHRGFDSWQWIRGQEHDKWRSGPRAEFDPKKHMPEHLWNPTYDNYMRQYLMNNQDIETEDDYICMRSCKAAAHWVKENKDSTPFMLWMDLFDPHEPWDAPPRFQKMYRDKYPFERYLFGYGCKTEDIRPEDMPVIKDLYAAEVTYTDHCIGWLLNNFEKMGILDNTIIVFTTDHGTHLGEEKCVQKTPSLLNRCVTHIPLIIRHPDKKFAGKRVDGLVSAIDFMPAFLDMLGVDDYQDMDGKNMWDLVTGGKSSLHKNVYTVFQEFGAVHNDSWHYFQCIKGKNATGGSIGWHKNPEVSPCLYDLKNDPEQTVNVIEKHPEVAKKLRGKLQEHLGIKIPQITV